MDYASVIYNILNQGTSVKNIVGANIFPVFIPQEANFPLIRYQLIGHDNDDVKGEKMKVNNLIAQIDMFGKTYQETRDLAKAVRELLLDPPQIIVSIAGDTTFKEVYFQGAREMPYDRKLEVFHVVHDYQIRFS